MGKAKTKTVDSRKPKHSNDSSRPSKTPKGKGGKEHRDASTVSGAALEVLQRGTVMSGHDCFLRAGAQTQYVQNSCCPRQEGKGHA